MKIKFCIFVVVLGLAVAARAATNDLTDLLQKGLFEEEANRDLHAAISNYQSLATAFDKDRQLAATAIFRLGECYRKLGKTNDAVAQYQRILKEFSDQPTLVTLSRQNLTGLNASPSPTDAANESPLTEAEANVASLQAQLEAIDKLTHDQKAVYVQQNFPNPMLITLMQELFRAQEDLIKLKVDYTPDHPKYKIAQELVDDLKRKADAQLEGTIEGLRTKLVVAQAQLKAQRQGQSQIVGTTGNSQEPVTDEEQQEIRRIQLMIQNSPDLINAPGQGINGNYTPLIEAAMKGQLVVAKYLLDHGADVNGLSSNHGVVPLTAAAENGHKAMVELLLARGADVSGRGLNPFYVAVSKGYFAVAEVLLANKADVNARSGTDNAGMRPVHVAARDGRTDLLQLLIQHGADVNATAPGWTPLGLACGNNNIDAVKMLLTAKADLEAKNENGNTALHEAASHGYTEVASLLLTSGAKVDSANREDNTPLILAVRGNQTNAVRLLLEHKADPNRTGIGNSPSGQNVKSLPIDFTIWNRNNDVLKLLLDAGANPDGESQYPNPLFAALNNNDPNTARLLLEHRANPNVRDREGYSLLTAAVRSSSRDQFIATLLDKGADPNVRDSDGGTPLFHAPTVEVARMLIEHRAEVNAVLGGGRTPLMTIGDTNIVALLLESGARVDMQDTNGSTALHYSVWRASPEDVSILLKYKANPNIQNTAGDTPLDLAQAVIRPTPIGALGAPRNITDANNIKMIADLLVQAGGLANLPKRNRIEVRRASQSGVAFTKGSRDWNRYSLLEMIAGEYSLLRQYKSGGWDSSDATRTAMWNNDLRFPDFKNVVVYRRTDASSKQKAINVNLEDILNSGDCSRDLWLEWGDVVEIPESDHPVDLRWSGLLNPVLKTLTNCLSRQVSVVIKGVSTTITLRPQFTVLTAASAPDYETIRLGYASFMLRSVLDNSKLVRVSSDLSRVKVTRVDPETKKKQEWTIDCTKPDEADLWLRDGDVIEVPEK